jgi:hypothetical protein
VTQSKAFSGLEVQSSERSPEKERERQDGNSIK